MRQGSLPNVCEALAHVTLQAIELAFSKKLADRRKEWMAAHDPEAYVDHSVSTLTYKTFIDKELVLFSVADCGQLSFQFASSVAHVCV